MPLILHFGGAAPTTDEVSKWIDDALAAGETLRPMMGDASREVAHAVAGGKHVLFEGAQGALLDVDHGTYPYVTSSATIAGGRLSVGGASGRP